MQDMCMKEIQGKTEQGHETWAQVMGVEDKNGCKDANSEREQRAFKTWAQ